MRFSFVVLLRHVWKRTLPTLNAAFGPSALEEFGRPVQRSATVVRLHSDEPDKNNDVAPGVGNPLSE